MKHHILPTSLQILGSVIAIGSLYRWTLFYDVPIKALGGGALGLVIIGLGEFWAWRKSINAKIDTLHNQVQGIVSMWTGTEKEHIESIAKGKEIE